MPIDVRVVSLEPRKAENHIIVFNVHRNEMFNCGTGLWRQWVNRDIIGGAGFKLSAVNGINTVRFNWCGGSGSMAFNKGV